VSLLRSSAIRPRLVRLGLVLPAIALVSLLAAPSAGAVPGWRPPLKVETVPAGAALSSPRVAARSGGCTTVAFERGDLVFAATRPPGGAFAPIQNLGSILPSPLPELAVGGGVVAAAWPNASRIRVATASGCDPLGAAVDVPGPYTLADLAAFPAVDSAGTTVVAFEAGGSSSRRIWVSERPAAGSPSTASPLPLASGNAFRPRVVANASGGVGIVFDVVTGGSDVYGTVRTGPGAWTTPVRLNEALKPASAGSARSAIGPDGSLHAVWRDSGNQKIVFATRSPAGAVSRTTIAEPGVNVEEPALAVDGAGRVTVAWVQNAAGQRTLKAKYREPGGAFSAQRDVSTTVNEFRGGPVVAIDRHGRTLIAWSALGTGLGSIQRTLVASRLPGETSFSGTVPVSNLAQFTSPSDVSTDADGNTVLALYMTESPREAQVAAFDAAGPLLGPPAVPSGVAGGLLPFSISTLDAWSPPTTTRWNFGDGASADGDSASHSYSAAGDFAVKASVVDALGNVSEASGVASISARPNPPNGGGAAGGGTGGGDGGDRGIPNRDLTQPRISKLRLLPRHLRLSAAGGPSPRLSFKLSEPAILRFTVKPRGGSFKHRVKKAGRVALPIPPRVRRALAPGRYRLRAVAVDAAGNRSRVITRRFTVLPS